MRCISCAASPAPTRSGGDRWRWLSISSASASERLLRHGANVNFQNSKAMTALHLLVKKNSDRKYIEMLLRHGADPTLENAQGKSALDMVANRRDKTLFDLFSKRSPLKGTSSKAK